MDPRFSFDDIWSTGRLPPSATTTLGQIATGSPGVPFSGLEQDLSRLNLDLPPPLHLSAYGDGAGRVDVTPIPPIHAVAPSYIVQDHLLPGDHVGVAAQPASAPPFHLAPNGPVQVNYITCQWFEGGRPCGTVMQGTEDALMLHLMAAHGVPIEAGTIRQEATLSPGWGSNLTFSEHLPIHHSTGFSNPKTCSLTPHVSRKGPPHHHPFIDTLNQDAPATLTPHNPDRNGNPIDHSKFTCRWVDRGTTCTDRLKAKDVASHLELKHGIASRGPERYACRWSRCSTTQPMQKASLIRHVKEKHALLKSVCSICNKSFTRHATLKNHLKYYHKPRRTQSLESSTAVPSPSPQHVPSPSSSREPVAPLPGPYVMHWRDAS